jgi:TonB family protein
VRPYFLFSTAAHGLLLAALVVVGTLLSKPRMSYYAVDIMSSSPAGGGITAVPAASPVAVREPPAPKMARAPKTAARAPVAEEERPDQETLRLLAKLKQKRLARQEGRPDSSPPSVSEPSPGAESAAPSEAGRGGAGLAGSGAGIVADAGPAFPYPWYLKAIADRLDKQWHPPQEFEPDTVCQVTFVINRAGGISGSKISKSSGDALFDQLALRAVLYANPLIPLPNGFPDDTLIVHMKFVGRRM